MRLTDQETEFIKKYRKLTDYQRGYVEGTIEALNRPPLWKLVKDEGDGKDNNGSHPIQ